MSRYSTDGRGKVRRPDDKRLGPHSPEHTAAIMAGQARARWSSEQSVLAQKSLPHDPVPMNERTVKAFNSNRRLREPRPEAVLGDCHWCYFWQVNPGHKENT